MKIHFTSSLFWRICVLSAIFYFFIPCYQASLLYAQSGLPGKTKTSKTSKVALSPPAIIPITAANSPKIIPCGKPAWTSESSKTGAPFFATYGTEQGLVINSVLCSATDKSGNLWFGTAGRGVCRYDGKKFTNYTLAQGLASNVVFSVIVDRAGNLWFGTTSGVSKFDGYRFTKYTIDEGLAGNYVTSILEDSKGNIWFGTHEGGLSRYDGSHFWSYTTAQGLPTNYIQCIAKDRAGNLWIGTGAGASKYDGSGFTNYTHQQGLVDNSINSILQDKSGNVWFGTTGGVTRFDGKNWSSFTTKQGLPDNDVTCILDDSAGNIWFGTRTAGISKYDGVRFSNYNMAQGLAENHITSILEDRDANLWFTTQGGGISSYWGSSLTNCTPNHGSGGESVFSITGDNDGNLWFGTYEDGAYRYNGKGFEKYTVAQGLPDNLVWSVMKDRTGNIWFGTDKGGASKFDGWNFTNYTTRQGLAANSVYCMMQDKDGNIWFGTNGAGASRFDGRSFTNFTTAQGLPGNNIQYITQDKKGNIWFGTHDNGASKYDGEKFVNFTTADGLPSNTVYGILIDKTGKIWFGTNEGFSIYDGKRFRNYMPEEAIADNYIWAMAADTINDIIWMGTNVGLSRLKRQAPPSIDPQNNEFDVYNESTGYHIKEVNDRAFYEDQKGILWVGTGHNELIRFDYRLVNRVKPPPSNLAILDVKINNEPVCWSNILGHAREDNVADSLAVLNDMVMSFGKILTQGMLDSMRKRYRGIQFDSVSPFYPIPIHLVLPYRDNNLALDFAAIEPTLAKYIKFQYKLEGYSKDWSPLAGNTTATFNNISPGEYTFRLKAVTPFGVWSEASYTFTVLPPWWATWWAYAIYALAVAGVLYTAYRLRIRSIERKQASQINTMVATQEEERKRISRDLHDDVGMKLSALKFNLSDLYEKSSKGTDEEVKSLALNSEQLLIETMQDVRRLLYNLSPGVLEEFGYTTAVEGLINKINKTNRAHFTLVVFGMEKRLKNEYELALYRITQELINNTLKHAEAEKVLLQIGYRDGKIILMIEDDGKGFDPTGQADGYGLRNLAIRTDLMKGTLTIDSQPGKGATVLIEIPYNFPDV